MADDERREMEKARGAKPQPKTQIPIKPYPGG